MRWTLWGITNYYPDFWDNIALPVECNKTILLDLIMERCGELYPYYQQPEHLKKNIENWFSRRQYDFSLMFQAWHSEYNPIENYNRYEDYTDTPNVSYTKTGGHKDERNLKDVQELENQITSDNQVSAFNTNTFSPDTQSTNDQKGNNTSTQTGTVSTTYQNETTTESGTRNHISHMHGNIGVTTNQQMLEAEIALRQYDIYINIVDLFEKQFLVQIY